MWNFEYPYTNFHELNLDWILSQLEEIKKSQKEFTSNVTQMIEDAINNGSIGQILLSMVDSLNVIPLDMFKYNGDGLNDDSEPIRNAIKLANETGKTVEFPANKKFAFNGTGQIQVACSINFNGSEIIANQALSPIFMIASNGYDKDIATSAINDNKCTDSELFGKSFVIDPNISLGKRIGYNEEIFAKQPFFCDNDGNLDSKFAFIPKSTSIKAINIQNTNLPVITIDGMVIKQISPTNIATVFVKCERNNVNITNISSDTTFQYDNFSGKFIHILNSFNNKISFNSSSIVNPGSGYVVLAENTVNTTIFDSIDKKGGWASLGGDFVSNMSIVNSNLYRMDSHYGQYGFINIENCRMRSVYIGEIGSATISVNNSRLENENESTVLFRNDLNVPHSATVLINGCELIGRYNGYGGIVNANTQGQNPEEIIPGSPSVKFVGSLVKIKAGSRAFYTNIPISFNSTTFDGLQKYSPYFNLSTATIFNGCKFNVLNTGKLNQLNHIFNSCNIDTLRVADTTATVKITSSIIGSVIGTSGNVTFDNCFGA